MDFKLSDWAQLCTHPGHTLSLHPTFIGFRTRNDAWHNHQWYPQEDHHVLLLVDEGYCDLSFNDGLTQRIGPGDCFLLHPHTGPAIQFSPTLKFFEIYIKIEHATHNTHIDSPFLIIKHAWQLGNAIKQLAVYHQQNPASLLLHYSVAQLLLQFAALHQEQLDHRSGLSTAQCNAIIEWTRKHIHLCPEPKDIAQLLNLTPDYCSRIFKQRFQMSLRDWLIHERIQEAARRISESNDSIEDIGIQLGFTNPAHFSRQFKKHMRCTASAWRKQQ